MSLFNIISSSSSDSENVVRIINSITKYNIEGCVNKIDQILRNSEEKIKRKILLPLVDKALEYLNDGQIENCSLIINLFNRASICYLKPSDIKKILAVFCRNKDTQQGNFPPILAELIFKVVKTRDDLHSIIDDTTELVVFGSLEQTQQVLKLISLISNLDPSLRVNFVFSGLIEQLLPYIKDNLSYCRLISTLISNAQSRKYVSEMGHIDTFLEILYESNYASHVTDLFRTLLSPVDLTHLEAMQNILFNRGLPRQLTFKLFNEYELSDQTLSNICVLLSDCIQYRPLSNILFKVEDIIKLAKKRPLLKTPLLYLLETYTLGNPDHIPESTSFLNEYDFSDDPKFILFVGFLLHSSPGFDYMKFSHLLNNPDQNILIMLVLLIQHRTFCKEAEIISQLQEQSYHVQLASILCLVTYNYNEKNRPALLQSAFDFFSSNLPSNNGNYQPYYFPREFIDWGQSQFNSICINYWLNGSRKFEIISTNIFSRENDDLGSAVSDVCNSIVSLKKANCELEQQKLDLESEVQVNESMKSDLQLDIIEARCRLRILTT